MSTSSSKLRQKARPTSAAVEASADICNVGSPIVASFFHADYWLLTTFLCHARTIGEQRCRHSPRAVVTASSTSSQTRPGHGQQSHRDHSSPDSCCCLDTRLRRRRVQSAHTPTRCATTTARTATMSLARGSNTTALRVSNRLANNPWLTPPV